LFAISKRLFHKGINKNISKDTRQQHQKEYNILERELQMETEVKEKAKQTTTNPKKDKQPSRVLKQIGYNNKDNVQIIQEWYGKTTSTEH
jgi:hypothetical protein